MLIGIDARLWSQTGVGRYIRNLALNLLRMDFKNSYILLVREKDYKDVKYQISKIKNSSKIKIVQTNILWHSLEEQLLFPQILSQYNFDLIHFPYYSVPVFYNKPYVVTIHDLIPLSYPTGRASTLPTVLYWLKNMAFRFVVSNAAKKAKKIIAPSKFSKDEIENRLGARKTKIEVIYEGADKKLIKNKKIKKDYFLYVGNAYPHKNLDFLIEAFGELPKIKLILVGKEDVFYRRLKDKVRNRKNIKFFGYATDTDLARLYSGAKALIIPSFIEGFGLPALEAMSNKCQVLASDIPVLHEVGANAALYFDPKDKEEFKNLVLKVYSNPKEYEEKIKEGLKRAGRFNWEKTARQTLQVYESCMSQ